MFNLDRVGLMVLFFIPTLWQGYNVNPTFFCSAWGTGVIHFLGAIREFVRVLKCVDLTHRFIRANPHNPREAERQTAAVPIARLNLVESYFQDRIRLHLEVA